MGEQKKDPTFSYQSVNPTPAQQNSEDEGFRPQIELGAHPQLAKKRGWFGTIVWQILAFLWLVPVVYLLYLNFTEHVIGASAWCPAGHCWLQMFNPITIIPRDKARQYDADSHDLVGGLQFVAKALEVWFGIIAASLIYLLTMQAAGKKEGLPVGYLTRPMEFADPITLLDALLWKIGPSPFGVKSAGDKKVGRRVWFLIALSVSLCVLINLMGPATAVLVIPALSYIYTPMVGGRVFEHMNSASPPQTGPDAWLWNNLVPYAVSTPLCNASDFDNNKYSCTLSPLGNAMDVWITSYLANGAGSTAQDGLSFQANRTAITKSESAADFVWDYYILNKQEYSDVVYWTPSRQLVSQLSDDLLITQIVSWGFDNVITERATSGLFTKDPLDTYTEYNKSLELTIMRNGPVLGAAPIMWANHGDDGLVVIEVDADRQIRCYDSYDLRWVPLQFGSSQGLYVKCIRTGSGWSSQNKKAQFFTDQIYNTDTDKWEPGVNIDVYSSDRAVFFENGVLPSYLPPACLTNGPASNRTICPWDRVFTTDPSSEMFNRTQNITTVEFVTYNKTDSTRFVVDFVAYQDFTKYSLNANPNSNPGSLVQTGDLPTQAFSVPMDPNWYLAAWSVDEQGSLYNNRTSTLMLQQLMQHQLQNPKDNYLASVNYDLIALLPTLQALSLIDYTSSTTTLKKSKNPANPVLHRWAQMYVWSYGISGQTAQLGVAVAILGCLVVLWQVVLGLLDRRRYRSPTQLIVAALEHSPRGEFDGKGHNELEMARVRFHIRDDDSQVGKFSFYEPEEKDAPQTGTP